MFITSNEIRSAALLSRGDFALGRMLQAECPVARIVGTEPLVKRMAERPHEDGGTSLVALRQATVSGLRWISFGRAIVELMMMGSLVVLARLIPPAAFGPYAVAVVVQEFAIGIQGQGVGSALVQRPTASHEHLQAGQALGLSIGVVLAGLTYVAAWALVKPIFGGATASLVALSSPLFIIYAIGTVPFATLRRRFAFRRLSVLDVANTSVRLGVSIGLAVAGLGARSLVWAALAGGVVFSVAAWCSAPPPLPRFRSGPVRDLLSYGVSASLAAISWVGFRNCDYAIIAARVGTLQSGFYFRAYTLAVEYQRKISDVMVTVAFPILARTADEAQLHMLRGQMVRVLTTVLFPLLTLLAVLAPVLLPWLLGAPWAPAVVPTQILAIGGASTLVIDTTGVVFMASGRSRAMLLFGLGHFAAYGMVVWFIAPYGIDKVAIVAAVVHTLFVFVSYALMMRGSFARTLRDIWTDVAPAAVSSLALAAVAVPASIGLSAAHTAAFVQLALVTVVGLGTYVAVLALAFRATWRDLLSTFVRVVPLRRRAHPRAPLAGARPVG
jgi:O-antigen/teichoic acid export membrane protein